MRKFMTILCVALTATVLTIAPSGCSRETKVHSKLTTVIDGREIKATIDAPAMSQPEGGAAVFRFGTNQVRVEKERLLLDGKERARIPAAAIHVEVVVSKTTLTVTAEGTNILTTKIER